MRLLSLKIKNLLSLETTNQYSNCIFLAYVFMGAEFLYFRSGGGFLWGRQGKIYDTKCYSWLGDGGMQGVFNLRQQLNSSKYRIRFLEAKHSDKIFCKIVGIESNFIRARLSHVCQSLTNFRYYKNSDYLSVCQSVCLSVSFCACLCLSRS